jgi:hypothetical protein
MYVANRSKADFEQIDWENVQYDNNKKYILKIIKINKYKKYNNKKGYKKRLFK